MGQRFQDLKQENAELEQALKAKFNKLSIRQGDLVVFKADQNPNPGARGTRYQKSTIGMSFGLGYGCMERLRRLFTDLAGGSVAVLVSSQEEISTWLLNRDERARLRATLDAIDARAPKPTFTELEDPLPPICSDASVVGTTAALDNVFKKE
jgi:hypothetical protein